jgi:hypothetical protein
MPTIVKVDPVVVGQHLPAFILAPTNKLQECSAGRHPDACTGVTDKAALQLDGSPETEDAIGVIQAEVWVRDPHIGITPLNPPIHESDPLPKRPRILERQTSMGTTRDGENASPPVADYPIASLFDAERKDRPLAVVCRIPVARGSSRPEDLVNVNMPTFFGAVQHCLHSEAPPQDSPILRPRITRNRSTKEGPGLQLVIFDDTDYDEART